MDKNKRYPEHEKLKAVKDQSQAIGSFLDNLHDGELYETFLNINKVLAKYFEIDLDKLEDEKDDMLKELRESQNL